MIAALLLAAGTARRFGADKTLAPLNDGTPLALAACATLRPHVDAVFAVVRPGAAVAPLLAAAGARLVVADGSRDGIGDSIAAGVRRLRRASPAAGGCIIACADMPFIHGTTVARLAAALRFGHLPVAPEYRGTRGYPLAFPASWFARLTALTGDRALRDLLAVHRDTILRLPVNDPGILADVDHPSDLEVMVERIQD